MEPYILLCGLCSDRGSCERTIELVISTSSRLNHHWVLHVPDSHSGNYPVSPRRSALRPCQPPLPNGRLWALARASDQKSGGHLRHIPVAAARSFRRTILLPAVDERVLDVGHKPAQPTLHEAVRISSSGFSS